MNEGDTDTWRFRFAKDFHISPFNPLDQQYDWRFRFSENRVAIQMDSHDHTGRCFSASMLLRGEPSSPSALTRHALRHPALALQTVCRIYWQALRLWLKRTTFHAHPAAASSALAAKRITS